MNNSSKSSVSAKTLSRKERESLQRRLEILDAAERLFAQSGFFKTSMADIAKESEFAVGSLYQFFKSKDEIYAALMEEKFEEFLKRVVQELDQANGVIEKVGTLITVQLQHFEEHRNFFRIYVTEGDGSDCPIKGTKGEKIIKHYETYMSILARVMQSGIRQGLFKKMDPYELAYLFSGMLKSVIHQWIVSSGQESLVEKAGTIQEVFFNGVLREKARS